VVVSKAVSQNEGGSGNDSKHIDEQA
jgi:hypothetical protein